MTEQRNLQQWVDYIQTLHLRNIDLSLERVRLVYQRLFPNGVDFKVITVAGTNGKGSTSELLRSIYSASGLHVGKYTSPHLAYFNERYQLDEQFADDQSLINAFEKIEGARQETTLTFFEFGTLAALIIFSDSKVDLAVMEVGLGGRLDAVNILDADAVAITNISIDHTSWLGDTIEEIGFEKVGVARANKPCVIGMQLPPESIVDFCLDQDVPLFRYQQDFDIELSKDQETWSWTSEEQSLTDISLPFGQTGHQLVNASVSLAIVQQMQRLLPISDDSIKAGVKSASLLGRCQIIQEHPEIILDVSHNVASIKQLASFIENRAKPSKRYAICGMLEDKQIEQALLEIVDVVDEWHLVTIDNQRGATAGHIREALLASCETKQITEPSISLHQNVLDAYQVVTDQLKTSGSLLVFGSFYLVGDIIRAKIAS